MQESYQDIVKKCADNEKDFPIPNRDANHASFIIKTLFEKATSEVYIFTGGLFSGVFGNESLIDEAIKFLNKSPNNKLRIVFQTVFSEEDLLKNSFIEKIKTGIDNLNKIELYDASNISSSIRTNHFCVIDNKAFRYELNHETREATANFGDTETATKLSGAFNVIAKNSKPIHITN